MRHVLKRTKVTSLVATELLLTDIANILDDLSQMLGWHVSLLGFHKTALSLFPEPVLLRPKPLFLFLCEFGRLRVGRRTIPRWRRCHTWWRRDRTRRPSWRRRRYRAHVDSWWRNYGGWWMNDLFLEDRSRDILPFANFLLAPLPYWAGRSRHRAPKVAGSQIGMPLGTTELLTREEMQPPSIFWKAAGRDLCWYGHVIDGLQTGQVKYAKIWSHIDFRIGAQACARTTNRFISPAIVPSYPRPEPSTITQNGRCQTPIPKTQPVRFSLRRPSGASFRSINSRKEWKT